MGVKIKLNKPKLNILKNIDYIIEGGATILKSENSFRRQLFLYEVLEKYPKYQALLPVDWKISEDTIVQPDNLVICHKPLKEEYLTKAP